MANRQQVALAAANFTRIQGVTAEQTISCDVLHRIIVAVPNAGAGGTVLVEDGTTPILQFQALADDKVAVDFNLVIDGDLNITPSDASIDLAVLHS